MRLTGFYKHTMFQSGVKKEFLLPDYMEEHVTKRVFAMLHCLDDGILWTSYSLNDKRNLYDINSKKYMYSKSCKKASIFIHQATIIRS